MSLESYLQAVPKVELHVHLEGSIRPETLLELARRNGVELPADSLEGLRRWFTFRDFDHFLEVYVAITRCLKRAEDYEQIVVDLGAELARQNVRYAEVTFSPSTHAWLGVSPDTFSDGLERGRRRAREEHGVEIAWVFDIVRSMPRSKEPPEKHADSTTELAIEGMENGVVALGLGGPEAGNPPERFARYFDRARRAGLRSTPHAGEIVGPESVWGAIRSLGADRIGHGVRSIEDPALVEHLAEHRIALEICPTSNLRLGVYASLQEHPLRRLHEAGVIVTVNSDDPPLFNTTLNDEILTLAGAFGFDVDAIDEILINAVRESFLPPDRRGEMETAFRAEMDRLKAVHLASE